MMLQKKLLCMPLTALLLTATVGCDSDEVVSNKHFSVYIASYTVEESENNKIIELIADELGYTFDLEYLIGNEADKTDMLIVADEYPDLVSCGGTEFIDAGMLVPIEDYITESETPNLYKHIEPIRKQITHDDGHIYIIPNYGRYYGEYSEGYYSGPAFWIQKAVLAEFGYPVVTTLNEYFDLIERYKEKYPELYGMETIGFEILSVRDTEWALTTAPNYLAGNPNNGDVVVDENGNAQIYADKSIAQRYWQKLREEYDKGIIDTECFVQSKNRYISKLSSGNVLGMFDQHWNFMSAETILTEQGMYDRCYVPLPIVFDDDIEPWYLTEETPNTNRGLGITVSCKNPQQAVKMLDELLSEKWQKILSWGIEGEDYMTDENGRIYRTEEQRENRDSVAWCVDNRFDSLYGYLPKIQGVYSDGNGAAWTLQPEEFLATLNEYDRNFLATYEKNTWSEFLGSVKKNPVYYPAWNISLSNQSQTKKEKLADISLEYIPRLIMGNDSFDELWEEYTQAIAEIDISIYESEITEKIKQRIERYSD